MERETLNSAGDLPAQLTISPLLLAETQLEHTSGFLGKGVSNTLDVMGRLLPEIPAAVGSTLADDWQNHKIELLKKTGISAGIGLGSAVIMARSPVLAKSIFGFLGLGTGYLAGRESIDFLGQAAIADSDAAKSSLVDSARKSLGRTGADLIEMTPGLLVGARAGLGLVRNVPAVDSMSLAVRHRLDFPLRRIVPERIHYLGADVRTVSGVAGESGTGVNLLKAADEIRAANPWRGVEEGRFFRVAGADKLKFSSTLPGTADDLIMGRRSQHMFHTHKDRLLPTSGDFNAARGTGVISVPEQGTLTFFNGTAVEAESVGSFLAQGRAVEAQKALAALQSRTFSSLVVDTSRGLAVRVDAQWSASVGLRPVCFQPLDYAQTVKQLGSWTGRLNLESIPVSQRALLQDGYTSLLRKLIQDTALGI